jgi:hypothetical protein
VTTIFDQTISGYSFEIDPIESGGAFRWAVIRPTEKVASFSGEAPDIDSAYAACEGVVRREGGVIVRRASIAADIEASNPGLAPRLVEALTDKVVAEILGA